ncbi:MAG: glycosyltransferase family 2 protein [Paeniclostridium sordellii]|uniref:glycosyltransferase family 2 protein n=1 Tax=Paraclostridium sordellii TaxID=1505 RepID=UPI0005DAA718|nr:glycosyltransferase family 2 protein [Paeniclostridium sordellii]MBS6025325.1 glycosyltransferase family 2 protein [Paeniclostridium sordellii]CEN94062.1 glycosyl transferase family protein [[Clostridium] sordellii] [Paeniclostridium sordellii]CEN96063.1 glycosyl transferase family protein [[Clostridium] sordellii] [Paeniclostridium sordellii]
MRKKPIVSIIIPTYKRPTTLSRAINSCINQSYSNIEIIVVDDNNSGDEYRLETETLMKNYESNENIKYIKHKENKNGSAARNTGIRASKGEYIAFLDDDDEFLSDKIEKQVRKMEELDKSWGACYTDYRKEKDGKVLEISNEKREGFLKKEALMRNLYISGGSNLLVRKSVIEEINGFDESFRRNQDLEFLVRILDKYKLAYVKGCSLIIHFDSRVTIVKPEDLERIDKLYIESFKSDLEKLSCKDIKDFYKMKELDMFKLLLQNGQIIKAIKHVIDKNLEIILVAKYVFYIINRKITKKCYGFRLD